MHLYPPVGPPPPTFVVLVLIWEEDVPVASAYVCTGAALVEADVMDDGEAPAGRPDELERPPTVAEHAECPPNESSV